MVSSVFRHIRGVAGIAAAVLFASPISGDAIAADAVTDQQAPSFAEQVQALMVEYPNGGTAFKAQLSTLALAQSDPAQAIATMMVALGSRPSNATLSAVIDAIGKLSGYSSEDLQKAITTLVSSATNPISAAQGVLAVASSLSTDDQQAIGHALGEVVSNLQQQDKTADATVIQVEVATSQLEPLTQAFSVSTGIPTTNDTSPNTDQGQPSTSNDYDPTGSVPEQPASAS